MTIPVTPQVPCPDKWLQHQPELGDETSAIPLREKDRRRCEMSKDAVSLVAAVCQMWKKP